MRTRWIPGLVAAAALAFLAGRVVPARAQDGGKAPGPAAPAKGGAVDRGPACAECHEEEAAQWKASGHAMAMKPEFLAEWEKEGKRWECLVCHTSSYDRNRGTYSRDGVGCESCHGPPNPGHPGKAKMAVKAGSETCQACHSITYAEWRLSAHGQKEVGCMACHKMHAMALRKEDPDQQCGSCHTERLQDFAHATHRQKGLQCITCHMPDPNAGHPKIKGTGVRGHSYGVGAETCAGCHRVQVHQGGEIADLKQEVSTLKASSAKDHVALIPVLEEENGKLKASLEANRTVFPWVALIGFVLGTLVGFSVFRIAAKKRPASPFDAARVE